MLLYARVVTRTVWALVVGPHYAAYLWDAGLQAGIDQVTAGMTILV